MDVIKTNKISKKQKAQINKLWNDEYPVKLKDRFDLLLNDVQNFNHYLIEDKGEVVAWAVEFEKQKETRFSIIIKNQYQGKGIGKLLINKLKNELDEFYGWVIDNDFDLKSNGETYKSPLKFYLKLGFEILENERINNEILNAIKIKYSNKI
jgi:GNAT superfamily N-acetyltransferase